MYTRVITLLLPLAAILSCPSAVAGTFLIEQAIIDDISIIQVPLVGSHAAGNMEIKIKGGFVLTGNAACIDRNYITTLKSVDADKRMFALLMAAQTTKQHVTLFITDDPTYTAFAGRCSLVAVTLQP